MKIEYQIKIYDKTYLDEHFYYSNATMCYHRTYQSKSKIKMYWSGQIVSLKKYGEQESLEIPNWAVEYHLNSDDDPEYFI